MATTTYTTKSIIGRGGMGCVYDAEDNSARRVALKMMSNAVTCYPEYRALFTSEVETLKKMNHPSVVKIVGEPYSDAAGNMYLPMEFIQGQTIEQYVVSHGPMPEDRAIAMMSDILDAMQYVHSQKCIHRDIKPSNIMIRDTGGICIIDFGIAKDAKIGATGKTVGHIIGTDGYMSPEQASGLNIDIRTDIYSLGCILFYMLTGHHAITKKSNSYETMLAVLHDSVPPPSSLMPTISQHTDSVVLRAVDKNMMHRYQSCYEFRQALHAPYDTPVGGYGGGGGAYHDRPTVTVGRSSDNDIVMSSQYVSGHHLTIQGIDDYGQPTIIIVDSSTNGTGIAGRRIHNETHKIPYTSIGDLPEVLLSGHSDCRLPWGEVIRRLRKQGWQTHAAGSDRADDAVVMDDSDSDLGHTILTIVWCVVAVLFPLVGWIIAIIWWNKHRGSAKAILWCATIAFAIAFFLGLASR